MRVLFTSTCKPIHVFLDRFLSIDDVSYRFIVDQGPFSASADIPCFSLHFLAQNVSVPSVVLEWPTLDELADELRSCHYDYLAITCKVIDMDRLSEMVPLIRRVSPDTKIVLGGYGTLGLNEPQFQHIRDGVDHVCWSGDGVKFMRKLLGEPLTQSVQAHLPVEVIRIPWMGQVASMFASGVQAGYLLSALGCVWKCEFCVTSAYTNGQTVDVMTPAEIVESMKWYYANNAFMKHVFIMDEELLLRKDKVKAIGKLIQEDTKFGLSNMTYLAFGTIKAISRWDPEELLLNGVGEVWTGVESKFSYQRKKGEADQKSLIRGLSEVGIEPQLSWIMGDDCQTKENIQEDIDYLISLEPTTVQLTTLSAFPGTALFKRLKQDNRVPGKLDPSQYHLFGNTMQALHFTHDEQVQIILDTYRRMYEELGPSAMRALGVYMNGYEYCSRSQNPLLNGPKRAFFKRRIEHGIFQIRVAIEMAPGPRARSAMENLYNRYVSLFGPMRKSVQNLADRALVLAEKEMERRAREGYTTLRDVPLKRFTYGGQVGDSVPASIPYADVPLSSLAGPA
jgi:haloalkane dehalogenase